MDHASSATLGAAPGRHMSSGARSARRTTRSSRRPGTASLRVPLREEGSQRGLRGRPGASHPGAGRSGRARDPDPGAAPHRGTAHGGDAPRARGDHRDRGRRPRAGCRDHGAQRVEQPAQPRRQAARRALRLGVLGRDAVGVLAGRRARGPGSRQRRARSRHGPRRARVRHGSRRRHPRHGRGDRGGCRAGVAAARADVRRRRRAELRAGRAGGRARAAGANAPRTPRACRRPARGAGGPPGRRTRLHRCRPPARRPCRPGAGDLLEAARRE